MLRLKPNPILPHIFARFSSTKPTPSKTHLHQPLPDSSLPRNFLLTGVHCGVKKPPSEKSPNHDLAIVLSTSSHETSAAACFTKNAFKAAPVLVSEEVLHQSRGGKMEEGGKVRAVVVNSGCANAVTGKKGMEDAWAMVKATDELLHATTGTKPSGRSETLVMSTGVIGQNLPISKILNAIKSSPTLGSDFAAYERAAKAFMTTDTFPKVRSRTFEINAPGHEGVVYRMAGMDKGAGMIHPDMGPPSTGSQLHATLLGLILTDVPVSPRSLQQALTYAVDRSFNSISVDGDMSTNDTVLLLANGAAHQAGSGQTLPVSSSEIDHIHTPNAFNQFRKNLTEFCIDLAKLVVRDGEGATKFVEVKVKNAPTYAIAHRIASRISTSALVKTALYGEDANWGRILAATGSVPLPSEHKINPKKVDVVFIPSDGSAPLPVLTAGEPVPVDEARAKKILQLEDINIEVDLHMSANGKDVGEQASYWTCDFSYEYVRINGDYRS